MKQLLESLAALHLFPHVIFSSQPNGQSYEKETQVVHSLDPVLLKNLKVLDNLKLLSICFLLLLFFQQGLENFPDIQRTSEDPEV